MTDGRSGDTTEATRQLKATGAQIMVIAVGNQVNTVQVNSIATKTSWVFPVEEFRLLDAIKGEFLQEIPCDPGQ